MGFERPQRGNPHQLTVNQHILPAKSIARFADRSGSVEVCLIARGRTFRTMPDNVVFCAKRCWDQRAEDGYMREAEDEFQTLADALCEQDRSLVGGEHATVTAFHVLWNLRAGAAQRPIEDQRIEGEPRIGLSRDEEELLEKQQIGFFRRGGYMPGRLITGLQIQRCFLQARKQLADLEWRVAVAQEGEFAVPDTFRWAPVVPLGPSRCLVGRCPDVRAFGRETTTELNQVALARANVFLLARDLSLCPGLRPPDDEPAA